MHIAKPVRVAAVYAMAGIFSLVLHGGVIALLLFNKMPEPAPRKIVQPAHIKATLVQIDFKAKARKKQALLDAAAKKRAQQRRKIAAEKEKKRKAKALKAKRDKARREKAKKEKLRKEKLKQAKAKKEKVRKAKALKAKSEKEKAQKLKVKKEKALQAAKVRKKREEQQALVREKELANLVREEALASALDDEEALLAAQRDALLVQDYAAYVKERIIQNWNRPPSARRGMEAVLSIQLLPAGQVVGVVVVKSSGSEAFDLSVQQAVKKVDRFEKLRELYKSSPTVFESNFRQLRLVFRPEDLRL